MSRWILAAVGVGLGVMVGCAGSGGAEGGKGEGKAMTMQAGWVDPYPAPARVGTRPAALGEKVVTESGLVYEFVQLGRGPWPETGDVMVIHGIGKFPDGKEFWNTRTENKPYQYRFGVDRVIRGFSEGMQHVRVGDRIVITMKPELGYGARGNRDIPPNSTLVFDYEILAIERRTVTTGR